MNGEANAVQNPAGEIWLYIKEKLQASIPVLLLWVLDSEGSSPGRRGFKMAVAADGSFQGTIGGGIMEHKLVEKARMLLDRGEKNILIEHQYHDKEHATDQSGMICSGRQLNAFVPLLAKDQSVIDKIVQLRNDRKAYVVLRPEGVSVAENSGSSRADLEYTTEEKWVYKEPIDQRPVIHIVGGGHVGLALSELMSFLGFYIKIYDNRPGLNTMEQNRFAQEKHIIDYSAISEIIESNDAGYLVIMTFGYRDDKVVFRQLLDKNFFYAGMMGSEAKIATLFKELQEEGIDPWKWSKWSIPIGINIYSKTTREIAVSIAAEIIREKNKHLPTGRTQREL